MREIVKPDSGMSRLLRNAVYMQARAIGSAFFSLASTRIILQILGAEEFGLYSVVAGFTAMLGFLSSAMTTATQRSFAFALGKNDVVLVNKSYTQSIFLHIAVMIVVLVVAETFGISLFMKLLTIPPGKERAALLLFQLTLGNVLLSIISVPYLALLAANEKMSIIALLSIAQNALVFALALFLKQVQQDPLILYGLGSTIVVGTVTIAAFAYCKLQYPVLCKMNLRFLKDLMSLWKTASYSGWNIFGALASVLRNQGIALLLNVFFGAIVNASYAISNQVSGQIAFISQSFFRSISPQIIKAEGGNDRKKVLLLTNMTCKYSFFLLALTAMPIIVDTSYILKVWLGNVPEGAVVFVVLIIIAALIEQLTAGIMVAMQAVGRIALYQAAVGSILLSNILVGFALLKSGAKAYSVLATMIALQLIAGAVRLVFYKKTCLANLTEWYRSVFVSTIKWFVPSCAIMFLFKELFRQPNMIRLISISSIYVLSAVFLFYHYALEASEKQHAKALLRRVFPRT